MYDHTARKKGPPLAGPTHSDHYFTWSSGVPTVHDDAVVSAHHLGASSEPIIPAGEANVLFRCVWDCKAAAGPCWRSGGRQRCSSPCCQADIPNLRWQEVSELSRLWCGAGQRYICSPRASLVGVAVKILKGLIFKMLPLLMLLLLHFHFEWFEFFMTDHRMFYFFYFLFFDVIPMQTELRAVPCRPNWC